MWCWCRVPRLTGRALQLVTWLLDSTPFAGPLWAKSMRDSGIPQASTTLLELCEGHNAVRAMQMT